jgi:hypothetical protein
MVQSHVIFQALLVALSGVLAPGSLLIMLLLFSGHHAPLSGLGYLTGYFVGYLAIGAAYIWGVEIGPEGASFQSYAFIGLGILLLFFALKNLMGKKSSESGNGFLARTTNLSAGKALGLGLLVTGLNVKNLALFLSALAIAAGSMSSTFEKIGLVMGVTMVFCSALYVPPAVYFLFPETSQATLGKMRKFVERHQRSIMAVALPVFGLFFLMKGMAGL